LFVIAGMVLLWNGQASLGFGWGDAGHKIVASIAYRRLPTDVRDRLIATLEGHPRFAEDFERRMPEGLSDADRPEWIFQQAAVWPDLSRGFRPQLAEKYHRASWHYINRPVFLSNQDRDVLLPTLDLNLDTEGPESVDEVARMNIVQAVRFLQQRLVGAETPRGEKAVCLCWMMHLVGDSHQPMHSTALFSRKAFPDGDKGGNRIQTAQRGNLHSLWDGLPDGRVQLGATRRRALEWMNEPELAQAGNAAAADLDVGSWIEESYRVATTDAYAGEVLAYVRLLEQSEPDNEVPPLTLSQAYMEHSGQIAQRRVVESGFRLAALLTH